MLAFVSFALGVSLLLSCGLPLLTRFSSSYWKDLGRENIQETAAFRDYISQVMGRLIAMGAGGPLEDSERAATWQGDVVEGVAITSVAESDYWNWWELSKEISPTPADRERWKSQAEAYHTAIQNDKNLLYTVKKGDEVLYSNYDLSPAFVSLPAGYNTLLVFADGKCSLTLLGEKVPIYGENDREPYVDDGEHWYLPGYVNFPAGEDTDDVTVCLGVADTPAIYVQGSYGTAGAQWQDNWLYWLEKNWETDKETVRRSYALLVVAAALLVAAFLLRRDKAQADRFLARGTAKLWFEVKILLALGGLALLFSPVTEEARQLLSEVTYAYDYRMGAVLTESWFWTSYLREILRQPATVLATFWTEYLLVNDLRYTEKPWRHGLMGILREKDMKKPIQKRIQKLGKRRVLAGALLFFPIILLSALLCTVISFSGYRFILLLVLLFFALYLLLTVKDAWREMALAKDLGLLSDRIAAVKGGDLTTPAVLPQDSDLRQAAQDLDDIQQGIAKAVEERTKSERMKVDLITNVSHDLKTPLTSIISYTELLKQEELPPPAGEYVDILATKAERLRTMVLDVFEISKASSGELPVKLEELDLAKLLRQTLADMAEPLERAPILLRSTLPEGPVTIVADGDRLYRVFQNLLQNAIQYSLEGSRVYLSMAVEDGRAVVSLKNTSKTELPEGVDFTGRFVRGDASRTDGGSGLGLAIAQSFTQACGGELTVAPVADLFVVTVSFPVAER